MKQIIAGENDTRERARGLEVYLRPVHGRTGNLQTKLIGKTVGLTPLW